MSTGDVRRPSLNKLVDKAAATDKPDAGRHRARRGRGRRARRKSVEDAGAGQGHRDRGDASQVGPARRSPPRPTRYLLVQGLVVEHGPTRPSPTAKATATKRLPVPVNPAKSARAGTRRPAGRPAARGPVKAGGGKGRKPHAARSGCGQGVNWGPIAMFCVGGSARGRHHRFGAVRGVPSPTTRPRGSSARPPSRGSTTTSSPTRSGSRSRPRATTSPAC